MASKSGRFANLTEDLQEIIDNKDSKQKYLRGIVKQMQHDLFQEVVKKILVPRCWMRETTSLLFTSRSSLTHPTPRD